VKRPGDPLAKSNRSGEALERAQLALRMNQLGEAERLASEVLKAERGNALAASLLGQALLAQNRADEAIAPLERAARRSGEAMIETLLAIALGAGGRRDEALAQLHKVTARRPVFPPAFRELASQLDKGGDSEKAIAVLEDCLAQAGNLVELLVDLATLYIGRNDRARARLALTKALGVAPGRPDIVALLARALLLDGEYIAAAEAYRHALAVKPDDAMTRAGFAVCLMEMGERDAGEAQLLAAMRDRPQLLYRAVHSLATSAHGRLFLRPSAVVKFLTEQKR
jgi:predicted Zn-dependent protease